MNAFTKAVTLAGDCQQPAFQHAPCGQTTATPIRASGCVDLHLPTFPRRSRRAAPHLRSPASQCTFRRLEFVIQRKLCPNNAQNVEPRTTIRDTDYHSNTPDNVSAVMWRLDIICGNAMP